MITYVQIREANDNRRVFAVPVERATDRESVLFHGILVASRWDHVWSLNGLAVVRDARYLAILEQTPILGETK